ncbi:MAG: enoyl-CoA hydratase/isomerase family protein [Pseudomonadota bacterium]
MIIKNELNNIINHLILSEFEDVLIIEMNKDKAARNNIENGLIDALTEALDFYESAEKYKSAILASANPRAFSVGAKIDMMLGKTVKEAEKFVDYAQKIIIKMKYCKKPLVAAINGIALGGGCELALGCHLRVLEKTKTGAIGLPENRLGVLPAMGGTAAMVNMFGKDRAIDYITNANIFDTDSAIKSGIVDFIVEKGKLLDQTIIIAKGFSELYKAEDLQSKEINLEKIENELNVYIKEAHFEVANPEIGPIAQNLTKWIASKFTDMNFLEALAYEKIAFAYLVGTEDAQEGITALVDKRDPVFTCK